jgi:large subunit ribosomal protein L17
MNKGNKLSKLGRPNTQRKALLKVLCVNLVEHGFVMTTEAKAKALRSYTEKMITKAKKGDLASRRLVMEYLPKKTVHVLFEEIAPKYKDRQGGYLRLIKAPKRPSDASNMAVVEFVN